MFWLLAGVALGVLIIVHEAGHYFVAKWSGMRVDRFSIGFGPALLKFRRGETEFQISAVPLGGYVQIAGMGPSEEGDQPPDKTVIEKDGKHTEAERAGWGDLDPRLYSNRPVWQRLATIFAGPGINYAFSVLLLVVTFTVYGVPRPGKLPMVGQLIDGAPAKAAGLELGDEVISIDGRSVKDTADVAPIIAGSQGRPITVVVQRGNEQKAIEVTPRRERESDPYRIGIGIEAKDEYVPGAFSEVLTLSLVRPYQLSMLQLNGIWKMIKRETPPNLSGPSTIVSLMKQQISRGAREGLLMIATISALLGFFNLLPYPGLDGGRLVFLAYEGAARRPFPQRAEIVVHTVGILTLFALVLFVEGKALLAWAEGKGLIPW